LQATVWRRLLPVGDQLLQGRSKLFNLPLLIRKLDFELADLLAGVGRSAAVLIACSRRIGSGKDQKQNLGRTQKRFSSHELSPVEVNFHSDGETRDCKHTYCQK
jgi:hypothetical protein